MTDISDTELIDWMRDIIPIHGKIEKGDFDRLIALARKGATLSQPGMAGWTMVPVEPTRSMWGNDLVRWLIRWAGYDHPTPKRLMSDLKLGYGEPPVWLEAETELQNPDHVVSKGTRAVLIYKAMLAAAPASPMPVERNGVLEGLEKQTRELDKQSVSQALPFEIEKWLITIKAHCTVIAEPGPDDDIKVLATCIKINVDDELRP